MFITQSPNCPSWRENSWKPGDIRLFLEFILTSFPLHCALALLQLPPILLLVLDLGCAAPHGAHPSNPHLPELFKNRNSPDPEISRLPNSLKWISWNGAAPGPFQTPPEVTSHLQRNSHCFHHMKHSLGIINPQIQTFFSQGKKLDLFFLLFPSLGWRQSSCGLMFSGRKSRSRARLESHIPTGNAAASRKPNFPTGNLEGKFRITRKIHCREI